MASQVRIGGVLLDFQPKSPEEIQRMMQFLLDQQAQFAADLAKTEATVDRISTKTERLTEGLLSLTGVVGLVADSVRDFAAASRKADGELRQYIQTVVEMFERHLRDDHGIRPS